MVSQPFDNRPYDGPHDSGGAAGGGGDASAGLETDERFPSGPWIGYYQQWNTQARQRLVLSFKPDGTAPVEDGPAHAGKITGGGRDPGGQFFVIGTYHTGSGKVELRKVYPEHQVEYSGIHNGDGIEGNWVIRYAMIPDDRGIFHIWPDASGMGEGMRREAEEPLEVASGVAATGESDLAATWPGGAVL